MLPFSGSKLLTGGDVIQMWVFPGSDQQNSEPDPVSFFIDSHAGATSSDAGHVSDDVDEGLGDESVPHWVCTWHCRPANSVYYLKFSSDGLLFASAGKADRLVKIWYENKRGMYRTSSVAYSYTCIECL